MVYNNQFMKTLRAAVFLALMAILLASCAKIPVETPPELYWPFPPEKPRVKFTDIIAGSIDVTGVRSNKFTQLLFGEEKEVNFIKPSFAAKRGDILYVTDIKFIHVYDFGKGKYTALGLGLFGNITGIAVSADGSKIFAGDSGHKTVFFFDTKAGKSDRLRAPDYSFDSPGGLAVDDLNGRLIVPDAKKHSVSVWSFDGKLLFSIGKRGNKPGEFNFPYSAAVDKQGRIYIVDSGNFRVQVFDKDGGVLGYFGAVGTVAGSFARPKGIALDSDGNIYVVDAAFSNFQIFDPEQGVFLAVGSNGSDPGKFSLPLGIAIDEKDRIYVVDQMNKRIQVFQYLKEDITPQAGPNPPTEKESSPEPPGQEPQP